jgi:hypothetical protein
MVVVSGEQAARKGTFFKKRVNSCTFIRTFAAVIDLHREQDNNINRLKNELWLTIC